MSLSKLAVFFLIGMVSFVLGANADLKAVFAFNDRVISMRFPEFNYKITTAVGEEARKIAVAFPQSRWDQTDDSSFPHMEISLEPLTADVDSLDYYDQHLKRCMDAIHASSTPFFDSRLRKMSLPNCNMAFLLFTDDKLRVHKGILVTSIDDGTGIVILLDTLAETYDLNEDVSIGILQSVQFEK